MISLILTIFCSTSIALILKYNDAHKGNPIILLAGNYFVASILSLIFLSLTSEVVYSVETLGFGALIAFLFVFSFFAFAKAVNVAGAALSTVSSRLSVIIPILLSIYFYHESPTNKQIIGFLFTLLTIIFSYFSLKEVSNGKLRLIDYSYVFVLLLGIGLADFSIKIFQQWRPLSEKSFFLFSIFTFSFIYSSGFIVFKRIPFEKNTIIRGGILGIPNIFSTFFLLGALAQLPAIVVYPVTNIGIILFTTIGAGIIWNEKLNRMGKCALILGIISIVLLGL